MKRIMLSSAALGALMAVSMPAQAADKSHGISNLGWVINWVSGKHDLDGSTLSTTNGKDDKGSRQDADNWTNNLGGEYVPGKGWVPSKAVAVLDGAANTIKDAIGLGAKTTITVVATPVIGKNPASVLGATVSTAAVTYGDKLLDYDTGQSKGKDPAKAALEAGAVAGAVETVGQIVPGGGRANDVVKSVIKTSAKTSLDAAIAIAEGKDPAKPVASDLTSGAIDATLSTLGVKGPLKDISKVVIVGAIKDFGKAGHPVGHGSGSPAGGVETPAGTYTPGGSEGSSYTPSGNGDHSGSFPSGDDQHGAGRGDNGNGSGDDSSSGDDASTSKTEDATVETFASDGTPITVVYPGSNSNPDEGSGTDNGRAAKLDQIGVHVPGFGKNPGDSEDNGPDGTDGSSKGPGRPGDPRSNLDGTSTVIKIGGVVGPNGHGTGGGSTGMGDGSGSGGASEEGSMRGQHNSGSGGPGTGTSVDADGWSPDLHINTFGAHGAANRDAAPLKAIEIVVPTRMH